MASPPNSTVLVEFGCVAGKGIRPGQLEELVFGVDVVLDFLHLSLLPGLVLCFHLHTLCSRRELLPHPLEVLGIGHPIIGVAVRVHTGHHQPACLPLDGQVEGPLGLMVINVEIITDLAELDSEVRPPAPTSLKLGRSLQKST